MCAAGTALVTGASRGLGRALAQELAGRGYDVIAGMRRPADGEGLRDVALASGGRLRVARLDLLDAETLVAPEGLRLLVNNAGIEAAYEPVEHLSLAAWREVFETNLFGLVALTRRAIPVLRRAGGGVICNVTTSSLLAPVPFFAAYRASKAAVSALGETLRAELAPFGIRVLEVMPGPVATDLLAGSDRLPEAAAHPEYRAQAELSLRGRRGVEGSVTPAAVAAAAIADAIADPDAPLRVACDPIGAGLLEGWRSSRDEELMRSLLAAFVP